MSSDTALQAIMPVLRAVSRLGLPGTGLALRKLRLAYVNPQRVWHGAPTRVVGLAGSQLRVFVDLEAWPDRVVYLTGHYYELHIERVLAAVLSPGDVAIDGGANHGMLMLRMAELVGDSGAVHAVEPNPNCQQRLEQQLALNHLLQVTIHRTALGEQPGLARLTVPRGATGQGTLATSPNGKDKQYEVAVTTGDAIARQINRSVRVIKLDVEGYELQALRGFQQTLSHDRPTLLTEVVDGYLRRAGDSSTSLLRFLRDANYAGFRVRLDRTGLRRRLRLVRVGADAGQLPDDDYLWLPIEQPVPVKLRTAVEDSSADVV